MSEPTLIGDSIDSIEAAIRRAKERTGSNHDDGPADDPYGILRAATPPPFPARFRDARPDDLSGPVANLHRQWLDGGMTANVLLLGSVGVGKTHAACALAYEAWAVRSRVWFVPVVELLDLLRPDGDPQALDRATKVDVLVLDDLGGERPTDWTGERLYAVVNRRWLEQRPTIVTSNLEPKALEQAVGPRVWSRLYHDALRVSIGGSDRRKAA